MNDAEKEAKLSLSYYQKIRDELLGVKRCSEKDTQHADNVLRKLLKDAQIVSAVKNATKNNEHIYPIVDQIVKWYDGRTIEEMEVYRIENPPKIGQSLFLDKLYASNIILFRESFIRFSSIKSHWNSIDLLYNIHILEQYAKNGCKINRNSDNTKYIFYHDTYNTILVRNPLCIFHPHYEATIIGYLLAFVAGAIISIASFEYYEWRQRRKDRDIDSLINTLSYILFESNYRFKSLPIVKAQKNQLFDWNNENLSKAYLEVYLPTIKRLRISKYKDISPFHRDDYYKCRELAEQMIYNILEKEDSIISMEIKDFVPILVEATKFFFNEAGKWVKDIRKKSIKYKRTQEHEKKLQIVERAFFESEMDIDKIEAMINKSVTHIDFYEIEKIINQIQTARKNLIDLETKAADFGGYPPVEDLRRMERETDIIIEKTNRLEELLCKIYSN